jgi:hypothetical protein
VKRAKCYCFAATISNGRNCQHFARKLFNLLMPGEHNIGKDLFAQIMTGVLAVILNTQGTCV